MDYPELKCRAMNCPMNWSVVPGELCSAHKWSDPKYWPSITDKLTNDIIFRQNKTAKIPRPVSDQEKQKIIASQRQLMAGAKTTQADPKAWAKRLQRKEDEGLTLSMAQRQCVRGVL